jgi:CHAD domain-containing protein
MSIESKTIMQPAESGKRRPRLDAALSTGEAVRVVLRWLLATIRANESGVLVGEDPEHLHDFRVAVRRTRTLLGQLGGALPEGGTSRFRKDFKWLGLRTGPVRDLDVWIEKLPRFISSLPQQTRQDLEPFESRLRRHRQRECGELARVLRSTRYAELIEDWAEFLSPPPAGGTFGSVANRPIRQVASKRIWRAYRKVVSQGRCVGTASFPEELHRLRIRCKKLRYLLEFFGGLYGPDAIESSIAALKMLQDHLGDFNDYSVQRELLSELAAEMKREEADPAPTAPLALLETALEAAQEQERKQIESHFERFESARNRDRFRELFAPN